MTPDPIGQAGGINLYPYVDSNPINGIDPHGLLIGSFAVKIINKVIGKAIGATSEGTYFAGKVADSAISTGIATGAVPQDVVSAIGAGAPGLQIVGGAQTISLGAIVAGGSSSVALPLVLAGVGGVEIGLGISSLYELLSGQPFGADIYDWLHPNGGDELCE